MPQIRIQFPQGSIEHFCQKYRIQEMQLFGSVLRDDFRPDSDIDILVRFANDTHYSLFDLERMQQELKTITGRQIDLVDKRSVETSDNYIRRNHTLNSAVHRYGARYSFK